MSSKIAPSAKCPFCLLSVFYTSSSLLHHLTSCVVERYTKDPAAFACSMCNAPLPSLLPALAHVQCCGSEYCAYFFKSLTIKSLTNDTPPDVVRLSHPVSHPFHLPIKDPFPPDEQEKNIRGDLTALFIERHPSYCDHDPTTPRSMTTTWDFIYHRAMQKSPSGSNHDGFRRGKDYTAKRHVTRRLESLNLPYDDVSVAQIVAMDNMLHLYFLRVGKQYFNKFVFDHFQQVLLRYSQFDQQLPCPTGRFNVRGNNFNLNDSRAIASEELTRYDNPVTYQLLYQSFLCVRSSLKSEHQAKIFCGWLCKGRNITITERSLIDGPSLQNWARREVSDSIDQCFGTCFGRLTQKFVSQHSLKKPPRVKLETSIITPNDSMVDHISSNSSFSSTNESVEDSEDSCPLAIVHDNVHLATCGMGPITSTANQFPPFSNIKPEVYNPMQAYPPIYSRPRRSPTLVSTLENNPIVTTKAPIIIGGGLDTQLSVNLSADLSSRSSVATNSTVSTVELTRHSLSPTGLNVSTTSHNSESAVESHSPENISLVSAATQAVLNTTQLPINSNSEELSSTITASNQSPNLTSINPKESNVVSLITHTIADSNNLSIAVKAVAAQKLALLHAKKKKNKAETNKSATDNHVVIATDVLVTVNKQNNKLPATTKQTVVIDHVTQESLSSVHTKSAIDNLTGVVLDSTDTNFSVTRNELLPNNEIGNSNKGSQHSNLLRNRNKVKSVGSSFDQVNSNNSTTISRGTNPTARTISKKTRSNKTLILVPGSGVSKSSNKKRSGSAASNGLCHIHGHEDCTLLEVHQPLHIKYAYDLSLCAGFDKLVDAPKSSCSRVTATSSNQVFVCKMCNLLPPGDSSRFFFCNHCNGQYHSKNMTNCLPPTRTRRTYDRNL